MGGMKGSTSTRLRCLLALAITACVVGATAAQAGAARTGMGGDGSLYVIGGDGYLKGDLDHVFVNVITVKGKEYVLVVDRTQGVLPQLGCRAYKRSNNQAWCALPRSRRVIVLLGKGADEADIHGAARWRVTTEVWGGDDGDRLEVGAGIGRRSVFLLGESGDDVLVGSTSGEALWGGSGLDTIIPGGGADHIDGGPGAFDDSGRPMLRKYARNDGECAARTQGVWDPEFPGDTRSVGRDTLDLRNLKTGALADLNLCRLGYFGSSAVALVHAMEYVYGTRFNDRLVGDGDYETLVNGNAGRDWLSGDNGGRVYAIDNEVDTIKCNGKEDGTYVFADFKDDKLQDPGERECRQFWKHTLASR
jgi:Ca2+-binding RTX toxin-like protein